jgi:hypothetical protein
MRKTEFWSVSLEGLLILITGSFSFTVIGTCNQRFQPAA